MLYTACPLVLFPVGPLTVAGRFVFDPVKGIFLTLLGTTVSCSSAYTVGRYFGKGLLGSEKAAGMARRYTEQMRANGFEAVLAARLAFLPFDLVNFLAGFLRDGWNLLSWRSRTCQDMEGGPGAGLGLVIVRGLIEAHGGTISAESWAGEGARFRFTLCRA